MSDWIAWIIAHLQELALLLGACIVVGKAIAEGQANALAWKIVAYIRDLVHDELSAVTEEMVAAVAAYLYNNYMPAVLKLFVSLEQVTAIAWAVWQAFLQELETEKADVADILAFVA